MVIQRWNWDCLTVEKMTLNTIVLILWTYLLSSISSKQCEFFLWYHAIWRLVYSVDPAGWGSKVHSWGWEAGRLCRCRAFQTLYTSVTKQHQHCTQCFILLSTVLYILHNFWNSVFPLLMRPSRWNAMAPPQVYCRIYPGRNLPRSLHVLHLALGCYE